MSRLNPELGYTSYHICLPLTRYWYSKLWSWHLHGKHFTFWVNFPRLVFAVLFLFHFVVLLGDRISIFSASWIWIFNSFALAAWVLKSQAYNTTPSYLKWVFCGKQLRISWKLHGSLNHRPSSLCRGIKNRIVMKSPSRVKERLKC